MTTRAVPASTGSTGYAAVMSPRVTVHESWSTVDPTTWDALVGDRSPFLEHTWLHGLELTGCTTPEQGWHVRPITVHEGDQLVAGIPAYKVEHDRGQFVYQAHWKKAADEAGLPLHPKFVVGVPFTPVSGARVLLTPDADAATANAAIRALKGAARGCWGLHVLFPDKDEAEALQRAGFFLRTQYQFHWHNRDYSDFDAFLADFRSHRRKEIRRERREVAHLDIDIVEAPDVELVDHLWEAYERTVARHGETDRFLNRDFFQHLAAAWRHRLVAVRARDGARFVAGAFNVRKGERLYGRYWGLTEDVRFLHFEVCYHQGVQYCIDHGLAAYEPGHGGEHKFRRGFEPVVTWSAHTFPHSGVNRSFSRAAVRERAWFDERVAELVARSPLKPPGP